MSTKRLSREDWLAAGFRAIAARGPVALKAESIARNLGTTKGSFYWHFKDLPDYRTAMLALWAERTMSDVKDAVEAEASPRDRLLALVAEASRDAPPEFGGRAVEPAIRAWALQDKCVAKALARADRARLDLLDTLLCDLGIQSPELAAAIYGAYIGLDDLTSRGHADIATGLAALIEAILPPHSP